MSDLVSDDAERSARGAARLSRIPVFNAVMRNGISPTKITGGVAGNVIPAEVSAVLNVRTIPGFEVAAVAYTTDIPLLTKWGTPLLFGPGSIHVAHTTDEFIDVGELRAAVTSYEKIVRALLQ